MNATDELAPDAVPDSSYATERRPALDMLGFSPAVEREFAGSLLRRARARVRAWHTIVLAMLAFGVLPAMLADRLGGSSAMPSEAWSRADDDLVLIALVAGTLIRAALVCLAWSPQFERLYPRIAFPLVAFCHGAWAFACSGEILAAHPEYLAPLVTDTFAAYFFSGLMFRHAVVVTAVAGASLLLGGWYYAGELEPIMFFGVHLFINMLLAAIAGFAHERSARTLFLEHALLSEMAERDGLTGLKNRRAFDEHLEHVWQQALRDRRSIAILMIDVDAFKDYNDRYGHQAGDLTLKRITNTINTMPRRPLDFVARYGGEEFAVILYEPSGERVGEIAEQLRENVDKLAIEHPGSPTGTVTVSVGAGIVRPRPHRSPQGALQLADQALYEAKRDGRNRVRIMEREYESLSTGVFPSLAASGAEAPGERVAAMP